MSTQIYEEQPTYHCITLLIFCSRHSVQGRYKFLSITSQHGKYVFSGRNHAPSEFVQTGPGYGCAWFFLTCFMDHFTILAISEEQKGRGGALRKWQQQMTGQRTVASLFGSSLLGNLSSALPILTGTLAFLRNEDHSGWWPCWPNQVHDSPRHKLAADIWLPFLLQKTWAVSISCRPPLFLCHLLLAEGL